MSFDVESSNHLAEVRFDVADVKRVIVHSDGFDAMEDRLRSFEPSGSTSLETLLNELRYEEDKDPYCIEHNRFKKSDDTTALSALVIMG